MVQQKLPNTNKKRNTDKSTLYWIWWRTRRKEKNQSIWVSLDWRSKSVAAFSTKTPETATAHRRSRMKFTEKATSLCLLLAVVKQKSSWLPSVFFDILPSSSYSKKPNENLDLISRVSWPYHAKQMSSKEFCQEKGLITKKSCKICFKNINVLSLVILYICSTSYSRSFSFCNFYHELVNRLEDPLIINFISLPPNMYTLKYIYAYQSNFSTSMQL